MLTATLFTTLALAAPEAVDDVRAPVQSIVELLDVACADLPEEACAPLYGVVEAIRAVLGPIKAEFCCGSCVPGKDQIPKLSCSDCAEKGGAWNCGSLRHNRRTKLVACGEPYVYDMDDGTLACY